MLFRLHSDSKCWITRTKHLRNGQKDIRSLMPKSLLEKELPHMSLYIRSNLVNTKVAVLWFYIVLTGICVTNYLTCKCNVWDLKITFCYQDFRVNIVCVNDVPLHIERSRNSTKYTFSPLREDCSIFFSSDSSNFFEFWYQKKAHIFLITLKKFYSLNVPITRYWLKCD